MNILKKKITLFLCLFGISLCLTGCQNKHDTIATWGKSDSIFDNIYIDSKDGYF